MEFVFVSVFWHLSFLAHTDERSANTSTTLCYLPLFVEKNNNINRRFSGNSLKTYFVKMLFLVLKICIEFVVFLVSFCTNKENNLTEKASENPKEKQKNTREGVKIEGK